MNTFTALYRSLINFYAHGFFCTVIKSWHPTECNGYNLSFLFLNSFEHINASSAAVAPVCSSSSGFQIFCCKCSSSNSKYIFIWRMKKKEWYISFYLTKNIMTFFAQFSFKKILRWFPIMISGVQIMWQHEYLEASFQRFLTLKSSCENIAWLH